MSVTLSEFGLAVPEIFLLFAGCTVLVVDVYLPDRLRMLTYHLSQAALVVTAIICAMTFPQIEVVGLGGHYVNDAMGAVLKIATLFIGYYAFYYARVYLNERRQLKGEFFVLGLFSILGMMVLISAASLLAVYLGLELLSLCLYAMVALNRDSVSSSEAAMKYFVLGALASGMLLYGMSLVYGLTGSIDLAVIAETLSGDFDIAIVLGLVFVMVGIAFKLGAVPFHMWVPDVYQGAPTAVTLFIGSAPKIAAFAMLMRLLVDGLPALQSDWTQMLILLSVLSMGVGNVVALAQSNLKRMLAYSTISHVGFLFLGIIAGTAGGYGASMFYIIVYSLMAVAAFGLIVVLGRNGFECENLTDFKGLNTRNPWYAFLTLVVMISMAGVPPFLGFWAKWSVLREVVSAGYVWLALVAVAFAVIGLFYYLRIVRLMYFDAPDDDIVVEPNAGAKVMISSNALIIFGLGLYPTWLLSLCVSAIG